MSQGRQGANREEFLSGPEAEEEGLDREAEDVSLAVMAASRLIVALSARALGAVDVSLTLPQLRSLVALHTCGPIKLVAMAATLGVTPPRRCAWSNASNPSGSSTGASTRTTVARSCCG
ncbi:hypothetical protein ACFQ1B_29555 [Streptomyces mexicanus]